MEPLNYRPSAAQRGQALLRRAVFFSLTFSTAGFATSLMLIILEANGLSVLKCVALVLFATLFTWISGAFWTAVAGFLIKMIGRDRAVISPRGLEGRTLGWRTAIIMPIYNEDVTRVATGIDAIWSSIQAQPEAAAFDFFVLSDTRSDEIGAAEERAWRSLVARHNADGRLFYRRRAQNLGRKAGNIADFVRNWGDAYEYFVILDADSVMTGDALVTLARLMDANPQAGIIQGLPLPAGRDTLFARMIQFAARLNGPMLASGLAFWQLGGGNYWGHNAILRTRPFASFCGLPHLPGVAPLGGEILSHDFVEAAFMRRAGYEVWLVPDLGGSWEEVPSNVIDFAARDRRWTQGNLQHSRVLPLKGLHWLSRMHMLTGMLSYLTSPMWFVVLVVSSILTCMEALHEPVYFQPGARALFPDWPISRPDEIAMLLLMTIIVLLLPKLLGATLALSNRTLRRGFGGVRGLIPSLFVEQIFSMLLAPVMMVFHSIFVVRTLCGKSVTWDAQPRSDRGLPYGEALRRHAPHLVLGLVWGAVIYECAPRFIWWIMPVLAGLLFSVLLAVWTSGPRLGRWLKRCGLLLTPEETATPKELAAVHGAGPLAIVDAVEPAMRVPQLAPLRMDPQPAVYIGQRLIRKLTRVAPQAPALVSPPDPLRIP
ncbi:MAG TPA: glucans biosynthesis glucosyltransferase MdoH [Steroidobacteraceae bacterium]|jgi:membrane glycosyltransferase|nr:glucans biosynthesis glucosyltransferase MdoH [Steroidobacteraceae bacterium]